MSSRFDRLVNHVEYAEAGIPAYWQIDLDDAVSLTPHSLRNGHYHRGVEITGMFSTNFPAPVTFHLDDLTSRRVTRSPGMPSTHR